MRARAELKEEAKKEAVRLAEQVFAMVKEAMLAQGLTRAELARRLQITRQGVAQLLQSKNPTIYTVAEVLDAVGLHIKVDLVPRKK